MKQALVSRLTGDRSGQVVIVASLVLPVLVGSAGLAVDYTNWLSQQSALQTATDSAALAATYQLSRSGSTTVLAAAAEQSAHAFVDANGPERSVAVAVDVSDLSATVSASEPADIRFARLFGINSLMIRATSTARLGPDEDRACILALDQTAKTGISISGSSTFAARNCTLWSNATSDQSIVVGGSAQVDATRLCAVGSYVVNGNSANISGSLRSECRPLTDPLAHLERPENTSDCTETNVRIRDSGNVTLHPGTYCGGLDVTADGAVTFSPGIYVIEGGPFKLTAGADVTGEGVGIFLSGKQATIDVTGQATVRLRAASEGPLKGVVVASDRAQTGNLSSRIAGGATVDLAGTVYLPSQDFVWRGNSRTLDPTRITQVIAKTVDIAGTTNIVYEAEFETEDYQPVLTQPLAPFLSR